MGAFAGEDVDFLALMSPANRKRLLQHSQQAAYPAGSVPFRAHEGGRALVLESGLVRTFWSVPDGREATTAFIYPGNLVGARNLVPGTAIMRGPALVSVQVVVDSTMRVLDLDTVR